MSWSYRIVRYRDGSGFGLHEVMFDENEQAWAMTEEPMIACGEHEGPQGILASLRMAIGDVNERDVFDEPEIWPGKAPGCFT